MTMGKDEAVLIYLENAFPEAKCSLCFSNDYECLVSVVLSAQTTDQSVNKVTPSLFQAYPDVSSLAKADVKEIEKFIKSLGLYHNKAKSLQKLGGFIDFAYHGEIPHNLELLKKVPGVGEKTARVFLLERGDQDFLPVDTHIRRISVRLSYSKVDDSPLSIEKKLERAFPKEKWRFLHHAFIEFGRKRCKSISPLCDNCPLSGYCSYFKKNSPTIGK